MCGSGIVVTKYSMEQFISGIFPVFAVIFDNYFRKVIGSDASPSS